MPTLCLAVGVGQEEEGADDYDLRLALQEVDQQDHGDRQ